MRLSDNSVLITGGSSGIGYALAEAFLASGSKENFRPSNRPMQKHRDQSGLIRERAELPAIEFAPTAFPDVAT